MKIALDTLGCKLNQAETEALIRRLSGAGHTVVASAADADVYILNTCTVTSMADAKSRHMLRSAHRRNGGVLLVAMGCYEERAGEELAQLDGVKVLTGDGARTALASLFDETGCSNSGGIGGTVGGANVSRTRAFIKIQDGCNKSCSYCIVPFVRGREKSVGADEVITEVRQRVAEGVKEVVLTGTEVGTYDHSGLRLKDLLGRILAETRVKRVRLSSLQPHEITPGLIGLWSDARLCPHFHLSLQSGSDSVLRRMRRGYSVSAYGGAVRLIRSLVPDVAVTTDVIVGFPGETDDDFEESLETCRQMQFARVHVFSYSPRHGTTAAGMPGQLSGKVKAGRSRALLALSEQSAANFNGRFAGRTMPVLWEHGKGGVCSGYTGNYIKVSVKTGVDLSGEINLVKLGEISEDAVWGEVIPD